MRLELIAEGFGYLESPRWHDDSLWFSDFDARSVYRLEIGGVGEPIVKVPGVPSGLFFHPEGMLVASMRDQVVLRVADDGGVSRWSDLSDLAVNDLNDMTGDARGNVFVGCFGYDLLGREAPRAGPLLHIAANGVARVACPDMMFANGMAVTADGEHLLVAESASRVITRFHLDDGGSLSDRTTIAHLGDRQPDGLCIDAVGGVWFASPFTQEFVRLSHDGSVTHVVPTLGRWAVACTLGGSTGDTLFALTAETDMATFARGHSRGRVEAAIAPYPSGG